MTSIRTYVVAKWLLQSVFCDKHMYVCGSQVAVAEWVGDAVAPWL